MTDPEPPLAGDETATIPTSPGVTRPGMTERITPGQFHEAAGVEDWRVLGEGACTYFRTGSFEAGARLVQAISELAGLDDHHPDVDLRRRQPRRGSDRPARPRAVVVVPADGRAASPAQPDPP